MILRIFALVLASLFFSSSVWAATLENPAPGSIKSGAGLIFGWVCEAEKLEVSFDGGPRTFVPYGSERLDTDYAQDGTKICGDTNNGFGLVWNYNRLGDGPHTATLYVDGVVATQVTFNVQTLGTEVLRGVTGQGVIPLSDGKLVDVQWDESIQGFTITGYREDGAGVATDAEAALNRLRGQWRVYYGDPLNDIFSVWDFSEGEIRQEDGIHVFRGDYASLDRIEWVDVFLADELFGPEWAAETGYAYVALSHDIHDDDYGNTCNWAFFSLTSTRAFAGRAPGSILYDDGTCGPIVGRGLEVTGVRVQRSGQ